jgi:uncharacterized protein involved in tolerance to divalent cations
MGTQWFQVQVVVDDLEEARALLRRLVDERLTASGTIVGPVLSIEWDHGVQETADRWLILALSTEGRVHDLVAQMLQERDQDAVQLVVLPVSFGDGRYLDRLVASQSEMLTGQSRDTNP